MEWGLLLLPSLVSRFLIRKRPSFIGVLQDLFVTLQLSCLPSFLILILQVLILYDGWIERKLRFRLDLTAAAFIPQLKEFKDSSKDLKIISKGFLFASLALLSLFYQGDGTLFALLGLPLLFLKSQGEENLVFLWEKQLLERLMGPFKKAQTGQEAFIQKELFSKNEISTFLDTNYPLYRMTHGFKGEVIAPIQGSDRPHIVFLFFESLRARELSYFGGREETLPTLNGLIEKSYFFPNFYANSHLTFRSFFSSLYGLLHTLKMKPALDGNLPVHGLPDLLKEMGYQLNFLTGANFDVGGIAPFLRNEGASLIFEKKDFLKKYQTRGESSWGVLDEVLFEETFEHLMKHREPPQFCHLLTISSHHPWRIPPSYEGPSFEDVSGDYLPKYLKMLHYTDRCIGTFLKRLEESGLDEKTVLFIMGDHGIYFGKDDKDYEYGRGIHPDNFHVPLFIHAKGRIERPTIFETLGSHVDLVPTVMDLLGLKGVQHSIGKSLLRQEDNRKVFFHAPVDLENAVYCRTGKGVGKSGKDQVATQFKTLNETVIDHQKTCALKGKKETVNLCPLKPSPHLKKEELMRCIASKSPLIFLVLNGHPAVDDEVIHHIATLNPYLSELYINGSYRLTDKGLQALFEKCPHLISLDISDCPLLTKEALKFAPRCMTGLFLKGLDFVEDLFLDHSFPALQSLCLKQTSITMQGIRKIPSFAPDLAALRMSLSVTGKELQSAIEPLALKKLELDGCWALSDGDFLELLRPHPYLRFLTLFDCSLLTSSVAEKVGELKIKHFAIHGYPNLTDKGFEALLKLPLDCLIISNAPMLTERSIELAKEHTPKFKRLNIEVLGSLV